MELRGLVIVLVDGPSGAGKSALADRTVAAWRREGHRVTLVRMDDVYPGWHGLARGSVQVESELVGPVAVGRTGRWRGWDWANSQPAEWHEVAPEGVLIVEGCGTLTTHNSRRAHLRIWLDADDTVRHRRAIDRDGEVFEHWWDTWQAQFEEYVTRESPRKHANIVLDGSAAGADRVVLPFPRLR